MDLRVSFLSQEANHGAEASRKRSVSGERDSAYTKHPLVPLNSVLCSRITIQIKKHTKAHLLSLVLSTFQEPGTGTRWAKGGAVVMPGSISHPVNGTDEGNDFPQTGLVWV